MSSTTTNLKNINFMSETRFDNLSEIKDDELYAVKFDELDDKADKDLNNMNPSQEVKATIVGWGIPDYTTAQTVNISTGTATAPVTGMYEFHGACNAGQYYEVSVNSVVVGRVTGTQSTGQTSSLTFFASAGDTITSTTPVGAQYVALQCFELKGLVNA